MADQQPIPKPGPKIERAARLRWVPIYQMTVSPASQRDFREPFANKLIAHWDPDRMGVPVVNERGGRFYIMDGQHRVAAAKEIYGETHQIQCWVYVGLTEEQEADHFLTENDRLTVGAFDKYRVSVKAGREIEADVDRLVRANGLVVTKEKVEGGVGCVSTLRKVYVRTGAAVFSRTLRIVSNSFGTPGLEAPVIDGIGLLCGRYNGELKDDVVIQKLGGTRAGVNGLLGKAAVIKERVRQPFNQCVAAAAVEILNSGKGGAKLPAWWREDAA